PLDRLRLHGRSGHCDAGLGWLRGGGFRPVAGLHERSTDGGEHPVTWQAAAAGVPGDTNATNRAAQVNQFLQGQGLTAVGPGDTIVVTQASPSGGTFNVPADIAGALQPTTGDPFVMPAVPTYPQDIQPL